MIIEFQKASNHELNCGTRPIMYPYFSKNNICHMKLLKQLIQHQFIIFIQSLCRTLLTEKYWLRWANAAIGPAVSSISTLIWLFPGQFSKRNIPTFNPFSVFSDHYDVIWYLARQTMYLQIYDSNKHFSGGAAVVYWFSAKTKP